MNPADPSRSLWDYLPPMAEKSTQHEGLEAANASRSERYKQVLELLRSRGPLAGWEIAEALKCQFNQVSGRLTELVRDKIIEDTGERRKNPRTGVSGRVLRWAGGSTIEGGSNRE